MMNPNDTAGLHTPAVNVTDSTLTGRQPRLVRHPLVAPESAPATVAHVVDCYRRYPGETVRLYTRLELYEALTNLTLRISLPAGLVLAGCSPPAGLGTAIPYTESEQELCYLVWSLEGELEAGTVYEFQTEARVTATNQDRQVESQAALTNREQTLLAQETVSIKVMAKGRYLRYLPGPYEQDELMAHLLMLFENFLAPLENQIEHLYLYFDPDLTPSPFLPWLAAWLDLKLDRRWPEAQLRQLIRRAIMLHRSRGTRRGLQNYLELYTGQQAEIIEHRARDFCLGPETLMGPGIALGPGNVPFTFTVILELPPIQAADETEQRRLEQIRQRTIASIIDSQKPAHTAYTLELRPPSTVTLAAPAAPRTQSDQTPPEASIEVKPSDRAEIEAIWYA